MEVAKPAEDAVTDVAPKGIADLPEALLCFLLTFLHGFSVAGQPPATCQGFAAACGQERLCAHVLERDFFQEKEVVLPQQPHRVRSANSPGTEAATASGRRHLRLQQPCWSDFFEDDTVSSTMNIVSPSAQELRAMARTLCGKGAKYIANVAAQEGRPALLVWAARHVELSNVDFGRSALMVAASNNRPQTVRAAITSRCCNMEQKYSLHGTALHMASYFGAAGAVQELCACNASLESQNGSYLQTPLLVACSRNHAEVVRILLQEGADMTARDKDGLSALRICMTMRSDDAAQAIQEFFEQRT